MPYKSQAQQGYFHANVGKKGITPGVVKEFDTASKGMKLPPKVKPKKNLHLKKALYK
jgi:RNA-binding protein YhbY